MLSDWRTIEAAARGCTRWRDVKGVGAEAFAAATCLRRLGLPMARSFRAATSQAARGERIAGEGLRFYRLFQSRLLLGALLALAVRVGAQSLVRDAPEFAALRRLDFLAITASLILGLTAPCLVRRFCPRPWTSDVTLLARWVTAHAGAPPARITSERAPAEPWHADLATLTRRELLLGVSLARERRALLTSWARARHDEARRAIDRLGDALPLAELLGIGVPAALLLAVPLTVVIKGGG